MSDIIVLDAGPLGLLANPNNSPKSLACKAWLASMRAAARTIVVPEVADYEVRRELLRINSGAAVTNLDNLGSQLMHLPLTTAAMRHAAQLWALARQGGFPTAADPALDCDVILAAQALSLNVPVIVATGNPGHLSRFVSADLWQNILP